MTRPWHKSWKRERGSFAQLPLMARALFREILVLTDDHGRIGLGGRDPASAVCFALGADRSDRRAVRRLLPLILAEGCLSHVGDEIVAPGYPKHNGRPTSNEPPSDPDGASNEPPLNPERTPTVPRTDPERTPTGDPSNGDRSLPDPAGARAIAEGEGEEEEREKKTPCSPPSGDAPTKRRKRKPVEATDEERRVFEYWKRLWGKNANAKLLATRTRAIRRALASHGYDACIAALDGAKRRPTLNDDGEPYDELELHLRNETKIEGYAGRGNGAGPEPDLEVTADQQREVIRQKQLAFEADQQKRKERHDQLNREHEARMTGKAAT